MEKWQVVALLLLGFALLVIAVQLRARYGEKYELKTINRCCCERPQGGPEGVSVANNPRATDSALRDCHASLAITGLFISWAFHDEMT